jgi:hypothetical protein
VPIALGGAGGPIMDAPEAFGIVYDPIETLAYVAAGTSRTVPVSGRCRPRGCGRNGLEADWTARCRIELGDLRVGHDP